MKKIVTSILAILGLATACERLGYENADVNTFASRIAEPDVVLLDVRTAKKMISWSNQNLFFQPARRLLFIVVVAGVL